MRRVARRLAPLTMLFVLAFPAHAIAASTLELQDNFDGTFTLVITGGGTDASQMTVSGSPGSVVVTDTAAIINESEMACTGGGTNTVTCNRAGLSLIMASLGNGNDRVQIDAPLQSSGPGIDGGGGEDTLVGSDAADRLTGGADRDDVDGRGGPDGVFGGSNDMAPDEVRGGPGADNLSLSAQDGNDTLVGGAGIDEVFVAEGFLIPGYRYTLGDGLANDGLGTQQANLSEIEDIFGHEGSAVVRGTNDPNVATILDGNDDIDMLGGPDKIDAGSQDDTIEARDGFSDRIQCGTGNDTVRADQLDELSGCENVTRTFVPPFGTPTAPPLISAEPPAPATIAGCGSGRTLIRLGDGPETRTGTARADLILAGGGNDVIDALAGNDCIDLGAGDDRGQGGSGNDLVVGGSGADTATGSAGNDRLRGDVGDDRLIGNAGNDSVLAGGGADRILGGFGDDSLQGEADGDTISGSRGRDRVSGGGGADRLSGGSSPDSVSGGSGNDSIAGDSARDRLSGGSGNDRISARDRQRDRISCGSGRDRVVADRSDRVAGDCESVSRR